jgi:hypothetical protein
MAAFVAKMTQKSLNDFDAAVLANASPRQLFLMISAEKKANQLSTARAAFLRCLDAQIGLLLKGLQKDY